eukprot:gene17569-23136_t
MELLGGKTNQWLVAQAMGNYVEQTDLKPSAILALGDNFYVNGISSSTDTNWYDLFEDIYLNYDGLNIPWYPCFGNHDYLGSVQAQLDRYTENPDSVWKFESQYYTKVFNIPGGGTVQVIFTDTTTLAPSLMDATSNKGGISDETQSERIKEQTQFIEETLESIRDNPPTWLLIVGHYPIVSRGNNGDTSELKKYLQPYVSDDLVHAFLCGAGAMTDGLSNSKSDGELIWSGTGYSSFGVLEASSTELKVTIINTNVETVYEYKFDNPNIVSNENKPGGDKDTTTNKKSASFSSSFNASSVFNNPMKVIVAAGSAFILVFVAFLGISSYVFSKPRIKLRRNVDIEFSESRKSALNDEEDIENDINNNTTHPSHNYLFTNPHEDNSINDSGFDSPVIRVGTIDESTLKKSVVLPYFTTNLFFDNFRDQKNSIYIPSVPNKNHRRVQSVPF